MGGVLWHALCKGSGAVLETYHMKAGQKLSVALKRAKIRRANAGVVKPQLMALSKAPYLRLVVSNPTIPRR